MEEKDPEKVTFCLGWLSPRADPEQELESKEFIWKGMGKMPSKSSLCSSFHWGDWSSKPLENSWQQCNSHSAIPMEGEGGGVFTLHPRESLADGRSWEMLIPQALPA